MQTVKAAVAALAIPTQVPLGLPLADVLGGLWRHALWLVLLFGVFATAASIRLEVQGLRQDLDRNARHHQEATLLNERLRLEHDARRRMVAVEDVAQGLELDPNPRIETVEAR